MESRRSRQQTQQTFEATSPVTRSPKPFQQRPKPSQGRSLSNWFTCWLLGGSMLAMVGVLVDLRSLVQPTPSPNVCQEIVQPQAILSREQLSQLLKIPERESKARVREIVQQPYCRLPSLEVRAGVLAEREAYPLAFDPSTWFVILYEGEEYAGYDFSFNR